MLTAENDALIEQGRKYLQKYLSQKNENAYLAKRLKEMLWKYNKAQSKIKSLEDKLQRAEDSLAKITYNEFSV